MLIGISGNICSGKSEVARFLKLQGFIQIHLKDYNEESPKQELLVQPMHSWTSPHSVSMPTTIPASPPRSGLHTMKETTISEEEAEDEKEDEDNEYDDDDDDAGDDDDDDADDAATTASVKKLIHELTDLTTSENEKPDHSRRNTLGRSATEVYPYTPKLFKPQLTPASEPPVHTGSYSFGNLSSHSGRDSNRGSVSNRAHDIPIHALKAGSMAPWDSMSCNGDANMAVKADAAGMSFDTVGEMLTHVTQNWQTKFVTTDIWSLSILEILSKRPFFLHIAVDAPLSLRFHRYITRQAMKAASAINNVDNTPSTLVAPRVSLESFVTMCDEYMYSDNDGIAAVVSKAKVTIMNSTSSLELFYAKLGNINLPDPSRLRPSWDTYFMHLANLAALRSNCMKRRVGCVIVRDKRVIATGYNGTPRGLKNCNEGGCKRCNDTSSSGAGLVTCVCLHAEENALLESGRDRIGNSSILYCNTCPCLTCSIKIVQTGIQEVVYLQPYSMDEASQKILREGNVILRQYIPPSEGLVM